eukprot:CAMPEP_0172670472 /NCGR_PEP_ID=MMETSP1074-20121228/10321_1 /TAXON_ID=2916 /ORGANISM="Ceratium fusus, Strain PA161109" /LENGTH=38 /DNA_ID= /DNA_START= /DNA_END= /DNA_ORIENTATION=
MAKLPKGATAPRHQLASWFVDDGTVVPTTGNTCDMHAC